MKQKKKVTTVLGWIVSILILCLGLLLADSYALCGVFLLLAGLAINPLVREKLRLKGWVAILLTVVLILLALIATPTEEENDTATQSPASSEMQEEADASEPDASVAEEDHSAAEPETQEASSTEPEPVIYNTGMYKVGTDISPGEYLLISQDSSSYYQVSNDASGTISAIESNDNFADRRYIQVEDGQYLTLEDCYATPVSDVSPFEYGDTLPSGMYKVGFDIPAGEYKLTADTNRGYYEVDKDAYGNLHSIVSNDNFENTAYIQVTDGQYLKMERATAQQVQD